MKRAICIILAAILVLSPASVVSAKQGRGHSNLYRYTAQHIKNVKEKKQSFKIDGSPVIKYGRYILPISPITKGMGATVTFNKSLGVLTVTKGSIIIVIDFKNQTVTVNGTPDTKSGIFTAKNNKKMTVLISYIAKILGCRAVVDDDDVIVTVPGLDNPTMVTVTPVGGTVTANTLNSTTLYLTASAAIKAGQAAGGKAELYVGSKLVAVDSVIAATDTTATFTTSDGTPVNSELQTAVPAGGAVTVKLYNAENISVTSVTGNPTLTVDYAAPTVTGIVSAVYSVTGGALTIVVTGGSTAGDKVDVTKLSLTDTALGRTYQLTAAAGTGSAGIISGTDTLLITLGSADKQGLAGFGTSTVFLTAAAGALLTDSAGNASEGITVPVTIPVTLVD